MRGKIFSQKGSNRMEKLKMALVVYFGIGAGIFISAMLLILLLGFSPWSLAIDVLYGAMVVVAATAYFHYLAVENKEKKQETKVS